MFSTRIFRAAARLTKFGVQQRLISSLRSAAVVAVVMTLLFSSLACGNGGSGGSGSGGSLGGGGTLGGGGGQTGSTGGTLSYDAINTVVQGGLSLVNGMQTQTPASREAALVTWLKQQPNVAAAASTNPGSVWARFSDGEYWIMDETFTPSEAAASISIRTNSRSQPPARTVTGAPALTRGMELPKSSTAVLLDSVPSFGFPDDTLTQMLQKEKYQVTQGDASVEGLKTAVNNAAVLHWLTHGSYVQDAAQDRNFYGMFTTTPATAASKLQYSQELAADRLVFYTATTLLNNKKVDVTDFAITQNFVTHYNWSFAPGAFAFINACYSGLGFTSTLGSLSSPAAFTCGWSSNADNQKAQTSALFIFDRLLGSNLSTPGETTPQRPFPIGSVVAEAQQKGAADASSTGYGACTLVSSSSASGGILAPSIEYLSVTERGQDSPTKGKPTLTLTGEFGSVQGTVKVENSVALDVQSWSNNTIKCDLPDASAPGGGGAVQVISSNGITSNSVPLTLWNGTVTYNITDVPGTYSRTWTVTENIYFRADVHGYRTASGGSLQYQPSIYFRAASPSTCNWSVSWNTPPHISFTPSSGTLPYGWRGDSTPTGSGFVFEGDINPKTMAINLGWYTLGAYITVTGSVEGYVGSGPGTWAEDLFFYAQPTTVGSDGFTEYTHPIAQTLSSDYTLPAEDYTGQKNSFPPQFNEHLKWSAIPGQYAWNPDNGEDDPG